MSGYTKSIAKVIGDQPQDVLDEVEDIMRHTIFHSTLDWQSKEQFDEGARQAYEVYKAMKEEDSNED